MRASKFWRWLVHGREDQYLPSAWLEDAPRLREYEAWTRLQSDPRAAVITKDSAQMDREAFWHRMDRRQRSEEGRTKVVRMSQR